MNKPEILAPAGSYEAFLAAVHNGCDAVYLGGKAYGARAYADNFDIETLKRAVEYASGYGVNIYYAINTLFKEKELEGLLGHVAEVINAGVDALIVQDLGVLRLMRDLYPEVEVHISTQMNCHSLASVKYLEAQGVQRVVLARELNLDEVKYIRKNTTMDIEAFVHGALCYCYSGQCLMSSFLGGRSGNRGRCAQPCRLPYEGLLDEQIVDKSHVLSPKDMETLSILPRVIDAGIDSLKIEGRMKSPEYVGLMTSLYRKYRDLYLSGDDYKVTQGDFDEVLQTFNRGGFTTGYYEHHNGPFMITKDQPKNQGLEVGNVLGRSGKSLTIKAKRPLVAGDCLEFILEDGSYESVILKKDIPRLGEIALLGNGSVDVPFRRIKSVELSNKINFRNAHSLKQKVQVMVMLTAGQASKMIICAESGAHRVEVLGEQVQKAMKQGLSEEKVKKQVSKVGHLPVEILDVQVVLEGDTFMAVSQLNALRREAFDTFLDIKMKHPVEKQAYQSQKFIPKQTHKKNITVLLNNRHHIDTVMDYDVERIYLEWSNFTSEELMEVMNLERVRQGQCEVWLALPRIMRHEKDSAIDKLLATYDDQVEGFLVRSIDGYGRIADYKKKIQWDYGLNAMNTQSVEALKLLDGFDGFVPSMELKFGECRSLPMDEAEVLVYGHLDVMTSAQCVLKTLDGCQPEQGRFLHMMDRKGVKVPVETNCHLCYNRIFNGTPLYLIDKIEDYQKIGTYRFRIELTTETEEQIRKIMKTVTMNHKQKPESILDDYTRGHFNKGVE